MRKEFTWAVVNACICGTPEQITYLLQNEALEIFCELFSLSFQIQNQNQPQTQPQAQALPVLGENNSNSEFVVTSTANIAEDLDTSSQKKQQLQLLNEKKGKKRQKEDLDNDREDRDDDDDDNNTSGSCGTGSGASKDKFSLAEADDIFQLILEAAKTLFGTLRQKMPLKEMFFDMSKQHPNFVFSETSKLCVKKFVERIWAMALQGEKNPIIHSILKWF